jgi:hypothetical protein
MPSFEKPALWDLLRDVTTNFNWSKKGYQFSKNTKSFAQAMKIYDGRRMCEFFCSTLLLLLIVLLDVKIEKEYSL